MQAMSRPTYNTVLEYAKAKPAIIFAPTRRHAQSIATDILTYTAGDAAPTRFLKVPLDTLEPFLERVTDTAAHTCASAGVGILHDTMSQEDIKTINHLFKSNALQVRARRSERRRRSCICILHSSAWIDRDLFIRIRPGSRPWELFGHQLQEICPEHQTYLGRFARVLSTCDAAHGATSCDRGHPR